PKAPGSSHRERPRASPGPPARGRRPSTVSACEGRCRSPPLWQPLPIQPLDGARAAGLVVNVDDHAVELNHTGGNLEAPREVVEETGHDDRGFDPEDRVARPD